MDELVQFLSHAQANVRQSAAQHVHQLTASPDGIEALSKCAGLVPALARLTGDIQPIAQSALSALINLADVPHLIRPFETCGIVGRLSENLQQEEYPLMQLDIILLSNLTAKSEKIVNDLLAVRSGATLLELATALKDDLEGAHETLDCVTNIVTNVSRFQAGRQFLQNKQKDLMKGLLEQVGWVRLLRSTTTSGKAYVALLRQDSKFSFPRSSHFTPFRCFGGSRALCRRHGGVHLYLSLIHI